MPVNTNITTAPTFLDIESANY